MVKSVALLDANFTAGPAAIAAAFDLAFKPLPGTAMLVF